MADTDPPMTAAEAAAYLRVRPLTLARWRKAGTGPNYAKVGKRYLYRLSDLEAYVTARRVSAPLPVTRAG